MSEFASQNQLTYTRYADDLTFSGDTIPNNITTVVKEQLKDLGYQLAHQKTTWTGKHRRQMVTGLVVNDKISIPRPLRRQMRALMHSIKKDGPINAFAKSVWTSEQLYGRMALQALWDKDLATKQLKELSELLKPDLIENTQ